MHHLVWGRLRAALARLFLGLVSLCWLSAIGQAALATPAPIAETASESSPRVASEEAPWVVVKTQPGVQWGLARALRKRIKERFDEEGIEIPFPQRVIHHVHSGDSKTSPENAKQDGE